MSIQSVTSAASPARASAPPTPVSLPVGGGGQSPAGQVVASTVTRSGPTSQAGQQASASTQPASREDIDQALTEVRQALAPIASNLDFTIDEDTGKTVIKIIDSSTDEVIKQIPSEEFLAISKALDKLQGLLIKQEV